MCAFILALQLQTLTLKELIAEIPHDAGAVVAYLMLGAFVFLIWYGSRKSVIQRYSAAHSSEPKSTTVAPAPDELNQPHPPTVARTLMPVSVLVPDRGRRRKPSTGSAEP